MPRIIHLSHSDIVGGAGRAAYRIHGCLLDAGVDSWMRVLRKQCDDCRVSGPRGRIEHMGRRVRGIVDGRMNGLMKTGNRNRHSIQTIPSRWASWINRSGVDVVHLHWICGEMISIEDVGRIRKPIVWTLHDMWPFCGAEHYTEGLRWQAGYRPDNRPAEEGGLDLNRWVWARKRRNWKQPMMLVGPSRWITECARSSAVFRGQDAVTVPNPLDLRMWRPVDSVAARRLHGLPEETVLVGFGAVRVSNPTKGFDLLRQALRIVAERHKNVALAVFGGSDHEWLADIDCPVYRLGRLGDDAAIRAAYAAVDVVAVPSRQEAFGQTASEAHACGRPVVGFRGTGLDDIVVHKQTGYLAEAFSPTDFAEGIDWILQHPDGPALRQRARQRAVDTVRSDSVARQYIELYESLLGGGASAEQG